MDSFTIGANNTACNSSLKYLTYQTVSRTAFNVSELVTTENATLLNFAKKTLSNRGKAYLVLYVVLALLIVGGNGLFIVSYYASRMRTFRKTANYMYFYIHLAVADLLVGLSIPFQMAFYVRPGLRRVMPLCMARYLTVFFPMAASVMCLLIISVDRYLAFRKPLEYGVLVTRRRAHVAMLLGWLISTVFGLVLPISSARSQIRNSSGSHNCDFVRFVYPWYLKYIMIPALLLVTLTLSLLYVLIFRIVHSQSAMRRDLSYDRREQRVQGTPRQPRFKQEIRVAKTGALVLGLFYACWLPFCIVLSIQVYSGRLDNKTLQRIRTFAGFPAVANSAVNCFVYAIRMPKFRAMVRELFCRQRVRHERSETMSTTYTRKCSLSQVGPIGRIHNDTKPSISDSDSGTAVKDTS